METYFNPVGQAVEARYLSMAHTHKQKHTYYTLTSITKVLRVAASLSHRKTTLRNFLYKDQLIDPQLNMTLVMCI